MNAHTTLRLTAASAMILIAAAGAAVAEQGTFSVNATVAAGLTVTEVAPLEGGLFRSGAAVSEFVVHTDGAVTQAYGDYVSLGSGQSAAEVLITGEPNATVNFGDFPGFIDDATGKLRVMEFLCDVPGQATESALCRNGHPNGQQVTLDGSGNATVRVGATLKWQGNAPAGNYTLDVPLTVTYL